MRSAGRARIVFNRSGRFSIWRLSTPSSSCYSSNFAAEKRIGWAELFDHELLKTKLNTQYNQGLLDKSKRQFQLETRKQGTQMTSDLVNIDAVQVKELNEQNHSEQLKITKEYTEQ